MSFRQPTYNFKLVIEGVQYDIDEPEGFMEVKSKIERDLNLHGVFYEYTPDHIALKFSGVAKTLLRGAFNADGVDSESRVGFLLEQEVTDTVEILTISVEEFSWTEVGTDEMPDDLHSLLTLEFDSKIWIIGGFTGATSISQKVWYTTDGITWTEAGTDSLPIPLYKHRGVVYNNKMWVIGGTTSGGVDSQKVYSSSDGVTWTEAGSDSLPNTLSNSASVVFEGKMWIIGGWTGASPTRKVYSSTDGITWIEAGTDALPVALWTHNCIVFDSKMWLIGGRDSGGTDSTKIYNTVDGATWVEVGTDSMPIGLSEFPVVEYGNLIWLIGGLTSDGGASHRKVYASADGIDWQASGGDPMPVNLIRHASIVFDSKIWLLGGVASAVYSTKVYNAGLQVSYTTQAIVQTVYNGNIDFSHAIEDNKYFYCSILRSDLLVDLLNNKDKEVNLLSGETIFGTWSYPESLVDIYLHSFKILKQFEGTRSDPAGYALTSTDIEETEYINIGFEEVVKDEIETRQEQTYIFTTTLPGSSTDAIIVLTEDGDFTIDVTYDFDVSHELAANGNNAEFIFQMIVVFHPEEDLQDSNQYIFNDATSQFNDGTPYAKNLVGSTTLTRAEMKKGGYIRIYIKFDIDYLIGSPTNSVEKKFNANDLTITIKSNSTQPATTAKGMLIRDALESNLRMITGLPDPLSSTFFSSTGCGYNNVLTNGWQIRKFEDQPIITSWKKLFKSLQAIFGLGYGVEGTRIKVEVWEHFYRDAELIDLGEVGNYKEEVMGDEIFNKIVLGFNSYANDENLSNTKEDFHTEAAWNTPIINHVGEFTQKSDIICSSFLIESVRRDQFKEKPSESTRWDDHLFLIATKKDYFTPYYLAERQDDAFETVTGLTNPDTAYNLRHTIKRMLLNWGVWINSFSMRYKDLTAKCRNLFFINNGDLTIKFNDSEACPLGDINIDTLTEKDDITKDEILNGEALFDQKTIKFTKSLSQEQLDIIRDAHEGQGDDYNVINYGYITVQDYDGVDQRGWLLDCTYNLHDKQADFVLIKRYALATPGSGETVGGYIELLMCLVDTGGGGITLSTTIPRISQLIYINGTITEIVIKSWTAALRRVRIKISKMGGTTIGGDNVGWDGKPILNKSGFSLANQLDWYESEVDLVFGENTIPINKSFSTDAYALIIERVSADVDIGRVTQPDPSSACQDIIYMGFQSYTAGSWNALSTQFPMWHEQKYNYSPTDTRSLFITNISYSDLAVDNGTAEGAGQQVIFAKAATLSTVKFFFTKTGSPTGTYKIAIWSTSAGLPDTQLSDSDITPVNGINSVTLNQALAADTLYAITITYNSDGLADASNYWSIRRLLSNGYRYGVSIEKAASVWSETSENLMTKITYVQS